MVETSRICPPITIDEGGDIEVYSTPEAACLDLEAVDVMNGIYDAFDGNGTPLRLEASRERVTLSLDAEAPADPDELARRLRTFIARAGSEHIGVRTESSSLPELLDALMTFMGKS